MALVDYAIRERVDFVLAAGDLYDGEWQDWRTGQFLHRQVGRLCDAGIPFIAISGNHDAQSVITRRLAFPDGARMLRHDAPDTHAIPALDVVIHGQGFSTPAIRVDLSAKYPLPGTGVFTIGLLHTNVDGRSEHENYAPSELGKLRNHGYHYWALGHVHTRAVLCTDPWIIYPGNLQGRHARETGARGAMLVTVRDSRIVAEPEFVPFDTVRWERLTIDVSAAEDEDGALAIVRQAVARAVAAADGRLLAARIELTGRSPVYKALLGDPAGLRAKLQIEADADALWIEQVTVDVRPPLEVEPLPQALADAIEADPAPDLQRDAAQYCKDMLDKLAGLRAELGKDHPAVLADADGTLPPYIVEQARALLRARLSET